MTTLRILLDEAGDLPNAEALWAEHVTPNHKHLELCNYLSGESDTTIWVLDTSDDESYCIEWEIDDNEDLTVTPNSSEEDFDDEDEFKAAIESAALFLPIIDQILEAEIEEDDDFSDPNGLDSDPEEPWMDDYYEAKED